MKGVLRDDVFLLRQETFAMVVHLAKVDLVTARCAK